LRDRTRDAVQRLRHALKKPEDTAARLLSDVGRRACIGEWEEVNVGAAPPCVLDRGALVAAGGAPSALAQHVARRCGAPADDGDRARQRRVVRAPLAVKPGLGRGAVEVAGRRANTHSHTRHWTGVGGCESSR
jgi:hypothetical protein